MAVDSVDHPLVSIQVVEEPGEVSHPDLLWIPWTSGKTLKVQSTNAPAQAMPIYYLSSLVSPLLGCILDNIEFEVLDERSLQSIEHLQELLHTIADMKIDAYLDLLQLIGHHTPKARKSAALLLSSFWPQSVGHVLISQPPGSDFFRQLAHLTDEVKEHRFFPWQFFHRHNWFSPGDISQHDCDICQKAIHGFGLLCPYCICAVHFDCYDLPSGSSLVQYANALDPHVQRIAMFRFSRILSGPTNPYQPLSTPENQLHHFQAINLFTLSPCSSCQQPLWGCSSQALLCKFCLLLIHPHCFNDTISKTCGSVLIDYNSLMLPFAILRKSCLEYYREILSLSRKGLAERSYEEISIFRDTLSTQLHILNQGLALGTVIVTHEEEDLESVDSLGVKQFELHHMIEWCEDLLNSDHLYASPVMEEYLQENGLLQQDHSMLYTWSSLVYVAASMKSPSTALGPSSSVSSDFLNVTQFNTNPHIGPIEEEVSHPFDMASLAHMRDILGHEFHIYSDAAAFHFLSHLHTLAFFNKKEEGTFSDLQAMQKSKDDACFFPLPLGLDLSIDVETLVSAIEACLDDIDLYVNEFGFLLLTRRMWPDGLMSHYALKRLAQSVLAWIINEVGNTILVFLSNNATLGQPVGSDPS